MCSYIFPRDHVCLIRYFRGVHGHFTGVMPWAHCDEVVDAGMARLVGKKELLIK